MSDLLNTNHDLLGLTSIFIVCLFTFILASSSTNLSKILLVALVSIDLRCIQFLMLL